MERTREAVRHMVDDRGVASASVVVRVVGEERLHLTRGLARTDPPRPATGDQAYDLASVTKALAGTTVVASLVQDGTLALDTRVRDVLDDVDPRITLAHLLTHASGYPAHRKLYELVDAWGTAATRRAILDLARGTPLESTPGDAHVYSDLGFLVLLDLVETVAGAPLDVLFHHRVRVPSGVADLRFGWPCAAATEDCPVRGGVVEGTVHDLNCAAMGGVSTHAGLFGTARAVALLVERLMDAAGGDPRWDALPGVALRAMWDLRGPGSHRGGWDSPTVGGYTSTAGRFPDGTVGHLGYTGTSVWVVPSHRIVVALLTNRVHPHDDKGPIREVRPLLHAAVADDLGL